jgi:hypothetical protein
LPFFCTKPGSPQVANPMKWEEVPLLSANQSLYFTLPEQSGQPMKSLYGLLKDA